MDPKDFLNSATSNDGSTSTSFNAKSVQSAPSSLVLPESKDGNVSGVELPAKKEEVSKATTNDRENLSKQLEDNNQDILKPGYKADAGKQLNENGEVEDSSTKKTLKAVGRGAAAYFSGGESIGRDSQVLNAAPVDKAIGVVSDTLEKVPGVEEISKELDEAGVADGVNDALDLVGSAKNGDIAGAIESGEKLKEDGKKLKKAAIKKIMMFVVPAVICIFFLSTIIIAICGPVLGGFLDVVESINEDFAEIDEIMDKIDTGLNEFFGVNDQYQTGSIVGEIENFGSLGEARQKILQAAAAAVSAKVPYGYGSHPYAAGLRGIPEDGLDCAGFVQWTLWTALGGNPGYLTTEVISNKIGTDFIEISPSELQPGDIGLKRLGGSSGDNFNHTGIYAGNGQWFHAAGGNTRKVVRGNYDGFTIYLRYKGVS